MRRAVTLALALALLPALTLPAGPARADGPAAEAAAAAPHVDPALAKDVRRLLDLMGTAKLGMQMIHQMIGSFRTMMPTVPGAFWDGFEKRINPQDLVDLMVPIYARHLSHAEVKALIRFYTSPTGRTLVKAMPVIAAESQTAGRQFGMKISQEAITELKAKGYHR